MSKTTLAQRQQYRNRIKHSTCHKKRPKSCRKIRTCRMTRTSSKRTHFCRKRKNTRKK